MDRVLFSEEFSELIIDADGSLVSAAAGCAKHLTATCHNARAEVRVMTDYNLRKILP
jgi:hypothetical protein